MTPGRAVVFVACLLGHASTALAQGIEITPFGGYRFGGDFFELVTGHAVDTDGAPAVGAIVDIPLGYGLQLEGLFTHQDAHLTVDTGPLSLPTRWHISVDHLQGGALQEYGSGRVRPFATGTLGLTRYAGGGDSEIRFSLGAGGGVKLFPVSRFGVRLGGQVFSTFVYANAWMACGSYACWLKVHTDIVWQAEFTAALVVKVS